MNLGINIRKIREENNKTMDELSEILNVAKITYNHYETQEKIIPLERLNDLANYLDVSIDYMFNLTSKKKYNHYEKDINKNIAGERLKQFRKENKLTQTKLAEILNTVHPTIVNYENGKNLISTAFLYTICKKYNISADYLLGKVNNPQNLSWGFYNI